MPGEACDPVRGANGGRMFGKFVPLLVCWRGRPEKALCEVDRRMTEENSLKAAYALP